jgi:hypothetical protein
MPLCGHCLGQGTEPLWGGKRGHLPHAHHGFNFAMRQPGRISLGHWLEYYEPAARHAEVKVRAFLTTHSGTAAADEPTAE